MLLALVSSCFDVPVPFKDASFVGSPSQLGQPCLLGNGTDTQVLLPQQLFPLFSSHLPADVCKTSKGNVCCPSGTKCKGVPDTLTNKQNDVCCADGEELLAACCLPI